MGLHTWFPGHPRGIGVIGCDTVVTQAPRLEVLPVVTSLCPIATSACPIRPGNPSTPHRATRAQGVLLCITPAPPWSSNCNRRITRCRQSVSRRATVRSKMRRTIMSLRVLSSERAGEPARGWQYLLVVGAISAQEAPAAGYAPRTQRLMGCKRKRAVENRRRHIAASVCWLVSLHRGSSRLRLRPVRFRDRTRTSLPTHGGLIAPRQRTVPRTRETHPPDLPNYQ